PAACGATPGKARSLARTQGARFWYPVLPAAPVAGAGRQRSGMPADPSGKTAVRIALLAFFIAFTGPVPAAESAKSAEPAAQPVVFRTWAKVALDASGRPTSIEPGPDLPAPVREYLAARIAQWHFSPPARGTTTGSAVTYLRLGACALPDPAGGYRLEIGRA